MVILFSKYISSSTNQKKWKKLIEYFINVVIWFFLSDFDSINTLKPVFE